MNTQRVAVDFINDLVDKYGENIKTTFIDLGKDEYEIIIHPMAASNKFDGFDEQEVGYIVDNFNYRHQDHLGWCELTVFNSRRMNFIISSEIKFKDVA